MVSLTTFAQTEPESSRSTYQQPGYPDTWLRWAFQNSSISSMLYFTTFAQTEHESPASTSQHSEHPNTWFRQSWKTLGPSQSQCNPWGHPTHYEGNHSKCCNCTNKTNKTNPKVAKCCNCTKKNNKTNSPGVLETGRLGLRTPGELVLLVFLVQLQHLALSGLVLLVFAKENQ